MSKSKKSNLLATYITYKELYESGNKNAYDIIAEFIKYVMINEDKQSFTRQDLSDRILELFGIKIPLAVINKAVHKIDGVKRDGDAFIIKLDELSKDNEFNQIQLDSIKKSNKILSDCITYIRKSDSDIFKKYDEKEIETAFFDYLLDNDVDEEISACFSKYIIQNSLNEEFVQQLNQIRTGHILFVGLNYNENINSMMAFKNPITIYLDMEILFNIVGYNDEIFQTLTMDALNLISEINQEKEIIRLRYFKETLIEIEKYFDKAEIMFENREAINPGFPAMKEILKNCRGKSDIIDKFSDFKLKLEQYGIKEDEKDSYYSREYDKYNLEDPSVVNDFSKSEEDYYDNTRRLALVSHINKIRFGKCSNDFTLCKAILLTETRNTILMSERLIKEENKEKGRPVPYAINTSRLTNILWYRIYGKFNKTKYPNTVDSVIRAQAVLASLVNNNIAEMFDRSMDEFSKGELQEEKLIARISEYSKQSRIKENINVESVEEVADFLSIDDIGKYDEKLQQLQEKYKIVENETKELKDYIIEKDKTLIDQAREIEESNKKIKIYEYKEDLRDVSDEYDNAQKKIDRYNKNKNIIETILYSILVSMQIILISIIWILSKNLNWDIIEQCNFVTKLIVTMIIAIFPFLLNKKIREVVEKIATKILKKKRPIYEEIEIVNLNSRKKEIIEKIRELE